MLIFGAMMMLVAPAGGAAETDADPPATVRVELGAGTGKVVSDLHFAANVEFYRPGLAAGVGAEREDFARALRDSGIRALRFPGGNAAYWYLPESPTASLSLCPPHVRSGHFVTLSQLAGFAREAGIRLIYELPCLFYLDGESPRAIVRSTYSDKLGYYDRDRVDEGVAYGLSVARRLLALGAPVAVWELGNEEFAHCAAEDYARVAAAYAGALRELDPGTPVIAVGMGKGWLPALVPLLREAGALGAISSFQVHYPFGNWPGPGTPDRKGDATAFVSGDLRMDRFLDAFRSTKEQLGLCELPTSVTETTAMRHKLWDPHAVIGTHGHALCYAWNWMTLLERPEVDIGVFHDLETPFFGILRYNVGFDRETRHFVWLDGADSPDALDPRFDGEYVLSPTGVANRLLAELAGKELLTTTPQASPGLRIIASSGRIIVVNRNRSPVRLLCPFSDATAEALTADSLDACLPGSYRLKPIAVTRANGHAAVEIPGWSVASVRRA